MNVNWRVYLTAGSQDRELVEAEVWYGDERWAVLSDEDQVIRFFQRGSGEAWVFNLEEVFAILNVVAKNSADGGCKGAA
jgi:hypothetical protein